MSKNQLLDIWRAAFNSVDPVFMLRKLPEAAWKGDSYLFWGKASVRTFEAIGSECRGKSVLGIYPRVGESGSDGAPRWGRWVPAEHPLPGEGSFKAGAEILEFFDSLRRSSSKRLTVFLSGGASSLAWLPWSGLSQAEVIAQLSALYRQGLDIDVLNAKRARLCQLKAGGAARWLSRLAPQVRPRVLVLSDVYPHSPQVVGSGPFWSLKADLEIPHRVLATNETLTRALAKEARANPLNILHVSSGQLGSWQSWLQTAIQKVVPALRENRNGIFIFGGEPSVKLGSNRLGEQNRSRGGRQTHLALALAIRLRPWLIQNRVEILAMSSDGCDGNAGAAGVYLGGPNITEEFSQISPHALRESLARFDSARIFSSVGALVSPDSVFPRSNVQDVLMIRVR